MNTYKYENCVLGDSRMWVNRSEGALGILDEGIGMRRYDGSMMLKSGVSGVIAAGIMIDLFLRRMSF